MEMRSGQSGAQGRLLQRHIRPERVMCLGFLALILAGTLLLALPVSSATGQSIGVGSALFTATSAVCVTGLIVVDTGTAFSLFGQVVLLVLIQMGGLGFMVFATLVMAALGRRITLRDRLLMRESLNTTTLSGLVGLLRWYGLLALMLEGGGAVLLSLRFVPRFGWGKGLYYALWHAVSAFCNAGFDLFGGYASLTGFAQDPLVLLTIAGLIILGGTGFAVLTEMLEHHLRWRRFSLHAKLVLVMTAALLLGGMVFIACAEWGNPRTLGGLGGWGSRLLNALFQSVTMRTAGFNSVELSALTDGTKLLCILLMLVGANSASTGGGMKTTTAAVVLLSVWAVIRGRGDVTALGRRIPEGVIRRAVAVMLVLLLVFLAGVLTLAIAEGGRIPVIDLLFEAASAMATVGVSSAGTSRLTAVSRAALIPLMYLGRIGPLTLAMALANRRGEGPGRLRYPEESVTIG